LTWQKWWISSLKNYKPDIMYTAITLGNPRNVLVDVTGRKNRLENAIKEGKLGSLHAACDTELLPIVKCPWGCTE
jgi:hypothetical protein